MIHTHFFDYYYGTPLPCSQQIFPPPSSSPSLLERRLPGRPLAVRLQNEGDPRGGGRPAVPLLHRVVVVRRPTQRAGVMARRGYRRG